MSERSIFKVEHTEPRTEENRWAKNHTTWVVLEGDAYEAMVLVRHRFPGHTIHVVRRHASGAAVIVEGVPGGRPPINVFMPCELCGKPMTEHGQLAECRPAPSGRETDR